MCSDDDASSVEELRRVGSGTDVAVGSGTDVAGVDDGAVEKRGTEPSADAERADSAGREGWFRG